MLNPKKIYISGPVTGTYDYLGRFYNVQKKLVAAGYEVINPAIVNMSLPDNTTHEEYMQMCITMMSMCDAIYFMKGYEKSVGCGIEFSEAEKRRMTIIFERDESIG